MRYMRLDVNIDYILSQDNRFCLYGATHNDLLLLYFLFFGRSIVISVAPTITTSQSTPTLPAVIIFSNVVAVVRLLWHIRTRQQLYNNHRNTHCIIMGKHRSEA